MKQKNCVIFFTKAPQEGFCKTRLNDFLKPDESASLQKFLIQKNYKIIKNFPHVIFYVGDKNSLSTLFHKTKLCKQKGEDIGKKMLYAFNETFKMSYKKVILVGSDLENLTKKDIKTAFKKLNSHEAVLAPSGDGGYSLVGLRSPFKEIFDINFSDESVLKNSIKTLKKAKKNFYLLDEIQDIDTKFDIFEKFIKTKNIKHLASGEYNSNYIFKKGKKKKLLRLNHASQMGLKNQIQYEYSALKVLQKSNVTPKAYKLFKSNVYLPRGALVMEFLKGRHLVYEKDLKKAAYLLACVHSVKIPKKHHFIVANKPFKDMISEARGFVKKYKNSKKSDKNVIKFLEFALFACKHLGIEDTMSNPAITSTELNSSNFIIGEEKSYIIDWEKPIVGDIEQDLAHFLAPTTTFFKTDTILSQKEVDEFLSEYEKYKSIDKNLVFKYIAFNCLRGVSWCAFANVSHQNKNAPQNPKIKAYLEPKFLEKIKRYFKAKTP